MIDLICKQVWEWIRHPSVSEHVLEGRAMTLTLHLNSDNQPMAAAHYPYIIFVFRVIGAKDSEVEIESPRRAVELLKIILQILQ